MNENSKAALMFELEVPWTKKQTIPLILKYKIIGKFSNLPS